MSQLFTIENDKIIINKLALRLTEGVVDHTGNFNVNGYARVQNDLDVAGTLTAETIKVKNLITETGAEVEAGKWFYNQESDLIGKGFSWTWGEGNVQLIYREGNRLWVKGDLDLDTDNSYKIDNVEVLSLNALGPQVTKSNLKELGTLRSLTVSGDATLSDFAYFNSTVGRLGLNTTSPNAVLSVVDNDVEFIIGSENWGTARIGTFTNNTIEVVTDNIPRITVKNSGEVVFGNEITKSGNVTIYGTLKVDTLVSDTRIDRYSSLEFKSSRDTPIYGQGLVWTGAGDPKQLVMTANPDRLTTTESLEVAKDQSYYIAGNAVLSEHTLGKTVVNSSLNTVGTLQSLTVSGQTTFLGNAEVFGKLKANVVEFGEGLKSLTINNSVIDVTEKITINVANEEIFYSDANEISIGNKQNVRKPIKVFGPLSVGVNNPDPTVGLSVSGSISFADKKFVTGTAVPTQGSFSKGDICWNQTPIEGSYVGWVCVASGAPGQWLPFGAIGSK